MPDNWGSPSPGPSPDYPDTVYNEAILEELAYGDEDAEESRLVRSASLGKRAKPTLVTAAPSRGMDPADRDPRPPPQLPQGAFNDGTGYVDNSSSSGSGSIPKARGPPIGSAMTQDSMLDAYSSASADDSSTPPPGGTPSPNPAAGARAYSRLSAIRRPPRLDMDAVRKAEARGSMTSLPDLIRRATRLAASLEKGRRPASRFDNLDDFADYPVDGEKHRSGLSDMLAAFPPPAHLVPTQSRRSFRDSMRDQVQSWPLPINFNRTVNTSQEAARNSSDSQRSDQKRGRRCCGLPRWAFILVMIGIVVLVVAAVVIPVEFFVIRKNNRGTSAEEALQQCQQQLRCANGGTNVVNDGVCACNCAGGFTGDDCTVVDEVGCTTIALASGGGGGSVTIGDALPRLLSEAQSNFSIPLSATVIVPKLGDGKLSCSAENALVTFDGRATRQAVVRPDAVNAAVVDGVYYTTITIVLAPLTTFTLGAPWPTLPPGGVGTSFTTSITSGFATTFSVSRQPSPTRSPTATSRIMTTTTMSSGAPIPTAAFAVSEEVLDFGRVAVLYILQEGSLDHAETAQVTLQRFFASGATTDAARNVTVGGTRSVDLVNFVLDMGGSEGKVGRGAAVAARGWAAAVEEAERSEARRRKRREVFIGRVPWGRHHQHRKGLAG